MPVDPGHAEHPFEGVDLVLQVPGQLAEGDRQPAHPRIAVHVDQVLGPQQHRQLAEVHLRHDHPVVGAQDVPQVGRERVQVAQVGLRDPAAGLAHPADGGGDRPVRRAPAEDQHPGAAGVVDHQVGHVADDAFDLGLPGPGHLLVVAGIVGHRAGVLGLLHTADPVLQTGGARNRPRPGEGLGIAPVRVEHVVPGAVGAVRLGGELGIDRRDRGQVRDRPRLGAVGDVAVGEQDHRRAVAHGQTDRLDRGLEAVGRATARPARAPGPRRCGRT